MNYVLDTNIILFYLKSKATKSWIEAEYQPFAADNNAIVSIVTIGELRALAAKNGWGARRLSTVEQILSRMVVMEEGTVFPGGGALPSKVWSACGA